MKYIILILIILITRIAAGQSGSLDMTFNRTGMVVIALGDADEDLPVFYIYPNPAKDKTSIEIKNAVFSKTTSISIYSINGDLLYSHSVKIKRYELSVRVFPDGIYIIKLTAGGRSSEQKLVINR